jgi:sulfoxide reductase heme-binding subunit YedZ
MTKVLRSRWTKVVLFIACLIPAAHLAWRVFGGLIPPPSGGLLSILYALIPRVFGPVPLIPPPLEVTTHTTGDWTIWFLGITLSITPLRALLNQPLLVRFRRMFGLFAFFYGCLHFSVWLWLDKDFDVHEMWADILKRKFIMVGMLGLTLMIPLAVTSTAGWVRRLGFARWQKLHQLIYFTALAGVIHYYWLVKSDVRLPLLYGAIFAVLMIYRFVTWSRKKPQRGAAQAVPQTT